MNSIKQTKKAIYPVRFDGVKEGEEDGDVLWCTEMERSVCVCMSVCWGYMCVCVCMCACVWGYMYVCTCVCECVCACMCVCVRQKETQELRGEAIVYIYTTS